MLLWSFALSVNSRTGGATQGRCCLLANAKKKWEVTYVELIQPTLDKWIGDPVEPSHLVLVKIWIKLSKGNFWALFDCGTLDSFVTSQKNHCFLGAMECVWKNVSSSCSFHFLQCLLSLQLSTADIREAACYEVVPRTTEFFISLCIPRRKSVTVLGCDAFGCPLLNRGCRKAAPENRSTSCNSFMCNTKGSTKPRNPTPSNQTPEALLSSRCFFGEQPRHCRWQK